MKVLETERLILRNWVESDVESLYEIASDEHVGPACGWEPHKDIEESQHILRNILMNDHTFAIILKEHNKVIGNIGFITMPGSKYCENELQHEIGFWLGYSYWGKGYMPEACKCLMRYGFEQLKLEKIICTHVIDNTVLLPGTLEVFSFLKDNDVKIGIVTTKFHYRIDQILNKFNLEDYVDMIKQFQKKQ